MSDESGSERPPPRGLIIVAFAAVYLIWGSTYLGIRFAVETLPPFLMGGGRFLTAGLILYFWLRGQGVGRPSGSSWRTALFASVLLLGLGNGGVNWAAQTLPSGLTALIIAGTPVWFALFDWLRPEGTRPAVQTLLGMGIGFAGVALLIGSGRALVGGRLEVVGVVALVLASMAWAIGSLYSRYTPHASSPLMTAAQQMIAGGLVLLTVGCSLGEVSELAASEITTRSMVAFLYLTLIGSLVGFTAYGWLLKATTPARVATYAYVNPVIAVFLGWAIGGERLTARMLWAALVIVSGVVIITYRRETKVPSVSLGGLAKAAPSALGSGKFERTEEVPPPQ